MARHQPEAGMNDGFYSVLTVRVPGDPVRAVGLLLVDKSDQVYLRLSDVIFSNDRDVLEIWSTLTQDLSSLAQDMGGIGLLRWLEDVASNFIEVGPVTQCSFENPEIQIQDLYDRLVLAERQRIASPSTGELRSSRFSPSDIAHARQGMPNTSANCLQIVLSYRAGEEGIEKIERFLNGDPNMAAQIIRLANLSAHSRGGQIRSIHQALIQVGTATAIGFMMAIALKPLYSSPDLRSVWTHSLLCRNMATHLAQMSNLPDPHEFGLLALVSDIGKVAFQSLPSYQAAYNQLRLRGYTPLACELMLCGLTHAEVSADILEDWSFPMDMAEAVRFHHSPSNSNSVASALLYIAECTLASDNVECDLEEYRRASAKLPLSSEIYRSLREPAYDTSLTLLQ